MNLSKREFLQVMGAASVAGMGLGRWANADAQTAANALYDLPRFGHAKVLSEQQIQDLMALLLDPKSPVNQ